MFYLLLNNNMQHRSTTAKLGLEFVQKKKNSSIKNVKR